MLQIDIVGIDKANENNLMLEVGGHSNPGRSWVKPKQDVLWRVKENIDVESIDGIMLKDISGNDNIFRIHQPQPVSGNKKIWKARVDADAPEGAVYIYNIVWKKKQETNSRTFDPILSIKPIKATPTDSTSTGSLYTFLTIAALVAALVMAILLYQSRQEIQRLKQPVQVTVPVR